MNLRRLVDKYKSIRDAAERDLIKAIRSFRRDQLVAPFPGVREKIVKGLAATKRRLKRDRLVAVELAEAGLTTLVLERAGGGFRVARIERLEFPASLAAGRKAERIKSFWEKQGLPSRRVIIDIPGASLVLKSVTLPDVDSKTIGKILGLRIDQYLPFPPDQVVWDWQVEGKSAEGTLVTLAAARKEELWKRVALLEEAGLEVAAVDVGPLVLRRAFNHLLQRPPREPTAFLYADGTGVEFLVLAGGALKMTRGFHAGAGLVADIEGSFDFCKRRLGGAVGRAFVGGPGADRIRKLLKAYRGLKLERLEVGGRVPRAAAAYLRAYGLALRAAGAGDDSIELLRVGRREAITRAGRRKRTALIAAAVGVIAVVGVAVLVGEVGRQSAALQEMKDNVLLLRSKMKNAGKSGRGWTQLLCGLREKTPRGVYLTRLSADKGKRLRVKGYADTMDEVIDYFTRVSAMVDLANAKLSNTSERLREGEKVFSFEISAQVEFGRGKR